jgi:hypothetical protein
MESSFASMRVHREIKREIGCLTPRAMFDVGYVLRAFRVGLAASSRIERGEIRERSRRPDADPGFHSVQSGLRLLAAICPHARWRVPEMAAERPVEMGKVGKAYFKGDVGDPSIAQSGVAQERHGPDKTFFQDVARKRSPGFFEKKVDVTRRDTELSRDGSSAQSSIQNAGLDYLKNLDDTRGTQAATPREFGGIAPRADRERNQLIDVGNDEALQLRRSQRIHLPQRPDI